MFFQWTRPKSGPAIRSPERDATVDASRIKLILDVVDKVVRETEAERDGLQARFADVLSRSSVTIGADSDEYLTRDEVEDRNQTVLGAELRHAEGRLKRLDETMALYQALRAFTASALPSQRDSESEERPSERDD